MQDGEVWDDGGVSRRSAGNINRIGKDVSEDGAYGKENSAKAGIWIVIVDDEEPIRMSVSQLLQLNYPTARVTSCSNAPDVLKLLKHVSTQTRSRSSNTGNDSDSDSLLWLRSPDAVDSLPDVIIADVRMPGMSGLDLVEAMRSPSSPNPDVSAWAAIPVILLTAKSALQDRLDGYRVGADAYLTKPFDPDELLALIDSVVERRNALAARSSGSASIDSDGNVASQPLSVQDLQRELRDIKAMLLKGGGAGPGKNGLVERTGIFLPPDERQVLELLCQGKTNPEIAAALFLSRRRVEQLLTAMYRKVSVKNRTELVRWAIATGQVQV
jgi:DNA-binding NarL/FixJ family response regulator